MLDSSDFATPQNDEENALDEGMRGPSQSSIEEPSPARVRSPDGFESTDVADENEETQSGSLPRSGWAQEPSSSQEDEFRILREASDSFLRETLSHKSSGDSTSALRSRCTTSPSSDSHQMEIESALGSNFETYEDEELYPSDDELGSRSYSDASILRLKSPDSFHWNSLNLKFRDHDIESLYCEFRSLSAVRTLWIPNLLVPVLFTVLRFFDFLGINSDRLFPTLCVGFSFSLVIWICYIVQCIVISKVPPMYTTDRKGLFLRLLLDYSRTNDDILNDIEAQLRAEHQGSNAQIFFSKKLLELHNSKENKAWTQRKRVLSILRVLWWTRMATVFFVLCGSYGWGLVSQAETAHKISLFLCLIFLLLLSSTNELSIYECASFVVLVVAFHIFSFLYPVFDHHSSSPELGFVLLSSGVPTLFGGCLVTYFGELLRRKTFITLYQVQREIDVSDRLLRNVLPVHIVRNLKKSGHLDEILDYAKQALRMRNWKLCSSRVPIHLPVDPGSCTHNEHNKSGLNPAVSSSSLVMPIPDMFINQSLSSTAFEKVGDVRFAEDPSSSKYVSANDAGSPRSDNLSRKSPESFQNFDCLSSLSFTQTSFQPLSRKMTFMESMFSIVPPTISEYHNDCVVMFADICNFTSLSKKLHPASLVNLLHHLFCEFDLGTIEYGVEKIKTIGDAIMIVSSGGKFANRMIRFALDMLSRLERFGRNAGIPIQMRAGIACGPVVCGLIGFRKFAWDCWGDSVNCAARMESHGIPGRVQIDEMTKEQLEFEGVNDIQFEDRGEIEVKGMGLMKTFFVSSSSSSNGPLRVVGRHRISSTDDGIQSREDVRNSQDFVVDYSVDEENSSGTTIDRDGRKILEFGSSLYRKMSAQSESDFATPVRSNGHSSSSKYSPSPPQSVGIAHSDFFDKKSSSLARLPFLRAYQSLDHSGKCERSPPTPGLSSVVSPNHSPTSFPPLSDIPGHTRHSLSFSANCSYYCPWFVPDPQTHGGLHPLDREYNRKNRESSSGSQKNISSIHDSSLPPVQSHSHTTGITEDDDAPASTTGSLPNSSPENLQVLQTRLPSMSSLPGNRHNSSDLKQCTLNYSPSMSIPDTSPESHQCQVGSLSSRSDINSFHARTCDDWDSSRPTSNSYLFDVQEHVQESTEKVLHALTPMQSESTSSYSSVPEYQTGSSHDGPSQPPLLPTTLQSASLRAMVARIRSESDAVLHRSSCVLKKEDHGSSSAVHLREEAFDDGYIPSLVSDEWNSQPLSSQDQFLLNTSLPGWNRSFSDEEDDDPNNSLPGNSTIDSQVRSSLPAIGIFRVSISGGPRGFGNEADRPEGYRLQYMDHESLRSGSATRTAADISLLETTLQSDFLSREDFDGESVSDSDDTTS